MNRRRAPQAADSPAPTTVRCAIYTRKSSDEGLDKEFSSLDAQRECAEAFIASQRAEGWVCLPDGYDDGGFSGGTTERPGLRRLMADIEAGKVDCVLTYKIDRLSRSLLDFTRLMEVFERKGVSFVAVTQQVHTGTSMGRLMLNVLMSFAQFEREIISERTRDKIAAARRKGKWSGGRPILGYDVDPDTLKLVVNEPEAERVREVFALYLDMRSLSGVATVLRDRSWRTKSWISRKGDPQGGREFDKKAVHAILTNVAYRGLVRHKDDTFPGEHEAIIDEDLWGKAQALLRHNAVSGGMLARNKHGAMLKGLLICKPCGRPMGHTFTSKDGRVRYRYYTCCGAQSRGWATCPSKSLPAEQVERVVLDQIRAVGRNPEIIAGTLAEVRRAAEAEIAELGGELEGLERDLRRWREQLAAAARDAGRADGGAATTRLADLHERIGGADRRAAEIDELIRGMRRRAMDEHGAARAMANFDRVWEALSLAERGRLVSLLVERVEYDGSKGTMTVRFRPEGLAAVGAEAQEGEAA